MDNCVFCKIINGEIPSSVVYEDEDMMAIRDIAPMAPVHVVMFLKQHVLVSANDITAENAHLVSKIFAKIPHIAALCGVEKSGYRVITNVGEDGGQTVLHMHFHLLGGKKLNTDLA